MKLHLSVAISDSGDGPAMARCRIDLADEPDIATLGLSLANAKAALAWLQSAVFMRQIEDRNQRERPYPHCSAACALATGRRLGAQLGPPGKRMTESVPSDTPVIVGLGSGYVRHRRPDPEGNFEVVAGRCLRTGRPSSSVAFVRTVDADAARRVEAMAASATEAFTDGDTQLRQWQTTALPQATPSLIGITWVAAWISSIGSYTEHWSASSSGPRITTCRPSCSFD